ANLREEIRWEACDDARELRRQIAGAVMMGVGGVLAVGCTVGQGLSALSVLSVSSPITIAAMAAGARLGLFTLVERTA
ncbi:MAG: YeeE/YedE thiosulfate transporter family protein, partial [Pseudomonadota bacterium]